MALIRRYFETKGLFSEERSVKEHSDESEGDNLYCF
jgi:hypothetical protein